MTITRLIRATFCSTVIVAGILPGIPALAQGPGGRWGGGNHTCLLPASTQPLTADEAKSLAFMREEEKLARDVYQQLAAKWDLQVFRNIARSEQRHFDAIGTMLTRYKAADPAKDTAVGVFVDTTLASFYNELMAKGAASLKDALEVGLMIEKRDIADLEATLPKLQKADLKQVYTNLLSASLRHQNAFERMLTATTAN